MLFECSPSFAICIFSIPLLNASILSSYLKKLSRVGILMVGVVVESSGSYISQFLNFVENCIDWCVPIKSHMFADILMMGKHMRCAFSVGIEI